MALAPTARSPSLASGHRETLRSVRHRHTAADRPGWYTARLAKSRSGSPPASARAPAPLPCPAALLDLVGPPLHRILPSRAARCPSGLHQTPAQCRRSRLGDTRPPFADQHSSARRARGPDRTRRRAPAEVADLVEGGYDPHRRRRADAGHRHQSARERHSRKTRDDPPATSPAGWTATAGPARAHTADTSSPA